MSVAIHAKSVNISGNDIRPSGSGAFCGVYDGILATAGTTGTIADNVIKDYREQRHPARWRGHQA